MRAFVFVRGGRGEFLMFLRKRALSLIKIMRREMD
jgi:hypothetical protein